MKKAIFITAALFLLTGCGDEEGKKKKVEAGEEVVTEVSQPENTESKEIKPDTKSIEGETEDGRVITSYHWHNIEAMEKAKTISEAVETIYGTDRYYYDHSKDEIELMTNVIGATYDNTTSEKNPFVFPITKNEKDTIINFENGFTFDLVIDKNVDMRMEMIDFFHFLKDSGLIQSREQTKTGAFNYSINLYYERLPGENYSEPSIKWTVSGESLLEMDFSNKEGIYRKIYAFGEYDGPYPSVDEQNQE
ncbi:hypothetical protein MKX78_24240 [Cytobacillus sp. FSL R5-0569]|uniref:hypothetical protein n=1 Tax=Cytobacillus TaxID=2675230 RepID=UPI00277E83DF|nr:hypothetical protein [Cytobacillus kochii]MDQ0186681.1 hypothetical protein [Cytobacillus kochii]